MVKKVILKATQPAAGDTIADIDAADGCGFKANGQPVRYLCPACATALVKNMPLPDLADKIKPASRLVLKCRCGAHSIAFVVPPAKFG